MFLSLTQYLCVPDNARDAVLLHVSASSERQEQRNKSGAMKKTTERHILTHRDACGPSVLCFDTVEHMAVQVTQNTTHTHINSVILKSYIRCYMKVLLKLNCPFH